MSPDLDRRIASALQARAVSDGEIDPAPLVRHARLHGGRIRRRRRALVSAGAATMAAVVAVAALVLPDRGLPGVPAAAVPSLPAAPDRPGAAARPELVGSDPAVLHFTAPDLVAGAQFVTWSAGDGVESAEARGGARSVLFVLARAEKDLDGTGRTLGSSGGPVTPAEVRVGDRPGTAWVDGTPVEGAAGGTGNWTVRWQPAGGLWAGLQILGTDRAALLEAAGRIRFNSAQRCVVPFRLTVLPPGMGARSCSVKLGARGFEEGSLLAGDTRRWFSVRVERPGPGRRPDGPGGGLTAGPYRVEREETRVLRTVAGSCYVSLIRDDWGSWANGVTEPEALDVLAGYRPAGDLGDVTAW
jgi:hypothetical protein